MKAADLFQLGDIHAPQILAVEKDFLVAYKPPRMHSAPLPHSGRKDSFFGWCAQQFPEIAGLRGRRAGEGGLLHRLDYETQGLLLLGRTQAGLDALAAQQNDGAISKEYHARATTRNVQPAGFPAPAPILSGEIESAFRPYGPGRKAVRPVFAGGTGSPQSRLYVTQIIESRPCECGITSFRLRIVRGFRHQIRCHLAWLRRPILNDAQYGGEPFGGGLLALRACALLFADPATGTRRAFSIPPINSPLKCCANIVD